ncbi:MAG: vWA domain-containing protein [Pseudomonadota bacterium]
MALLWVLWPAALRAEVRRDHVRVVLDTSASLKRLDPKKLVKLSTLLLFDLAHPNLTVPAGGAAPESSFVIYPFVQDWSERGGAKCENFYPSSSRTATPIAPRGDLATARAQLVSALAGVSYEAQCTYFHAGLQHAVEDLATTPGGSLDRRVIVLITDGLPDNPGEDQARIRKLLPQLEAAHIRLYVLAFGPEATSNTSMFDEMVRGTGGSPLGRAFYDHSGDGLLEAMLDLFAASFGYVNTPGGTRGAGTSLPLLPASMSGTPVKPERAIVVAYDTHATPPGLRLTPPPGGRLNLETPAFGLDSGGVGAAYGYSLHHVLHPDQGDYAFGPAGAATLAVLRPTELILDVEYAGRSGHPAGTVGAAPRVMAGEEFNLLVTPRPEGGATADTPEVDIHFRSHRGAWDTESPGYRGSEDPGGSPSAGVTAGGVRSYSITPSFSQDPAPGENYYMGYIEIDALLGAAVVGSSRGGQSFHVEVWPRLRILPSPAIGDATTGSGSSPALRRGQEGCATFHFNVDVGPNGNQLPVLSPPDRYPLRAVLDPTIKLEGPLAGAIVTLDGRRLEVDAAPGPVPGDWYIGRTLSAAEFVEDEHEVCLQLGKPTAGDPAVHLPLVFTLMSAPYDEFKVVEPFTLHASVAPPSWLERWGKLFALLALLLALAALLWGLRPRPDLPSDFGYSVGSGGGPAPSFRHFPEQGRLAGLLALTHRPPLLSADESHPLGTIVPVEGDLYLFKPAPGVAPPRDALGGALERRPDGGVLLHAQRDYLVRAGDGRDELFRLEYHA